MTEVEQLVLNVTSTGADVVGGLLDRIDRVTSSILSHLPGLNVESGSLISVFGSLASGVASVTNELIDASKKYDNYNASLEVATKSTWGAAVAFDALRSFAEKTPFTLDQVVSGFTILTNRGLDPSLKALTAYSNIASAFNRPLDQVVQALGRGTDGMTRGLETFGIHAEKVGDNLKLSFHGITTLVKNSTDAIQSYLINIGNTDFAGAAVKRSQTLTGEIQQLQNAWDLLWIDIARAGPDTFIGQAFAIATKAVRDFDAIFTSGELVFRVKMYGLLWLGTWNNIKSEAGDAVNLITSTLESAVTLWGLLANKNDKDWQYAFSHFPLYLDSSVAHMYNSIEAFVEKAKAYFQYLVDTWKNMTTEMSSDASALASTVTDAVHGNFHSPGPSFDTADIVAQQTQLKALLDLKEKLTAADMHYNSVEDFAANTLDQDLTKYDSQIAAAKKQLADLQDAARAAKKAASADDPLAQFQNPNNREQTTTAERNAAALQKKVLAQQVLELQKSLTDQDHVLKTGYEEQKKIILASTTTTEEEKKNLILKLLANSLETQDQALRDNYKTQHDLILSATLLTAEEKQKLILRLDRDTNQKILDNQIKQQNLQLDKASTFFGNLAAIGSTFGKKGFEISKAASIVQATIKTYEAATSAYASLAGIPYIGPALGAAAAAAAIAAGAANVAQIKASQYQPQAYALGGLIGAGNYGIVGEAGPEIVQGPAFVTSAKESASAFGRGGGVTTVTVHNFGAPVEAHSTLSNGELYVILKPLLAQTKAETKAEIAADIVKGGTPITQKLEKTYGVNRANNKT